MDEDGVESVDKVGAWRQQVLEEAGFSIESAILLASNTSVDLHRAVELLRSGCPVSTALRILT
jgi:hypothetical protein